MCLGLKEVHILQRKKLGWRRSVRGCQGGVGTVEPLLSGHPRGIGNWPLNRGWPLNKGSSGIKFWLRENVNLFKYKHALSFLTIVTCNTAITLSSKNHTNPVKNILDKVSTRTI